MVIPSNSFWEVTTQHNFSTWRLRISQPKNWTFFQEWTAHHILTSFHAPANTTITIGSSYIIHFVAIGPYESLVARVWRFKCDLNFSKWSFFMFLADLTAEFDDWTGMLLSTIGHYSRWDGVVSSSEQWEVGIESQMVTKYSIFFSDGIMTSVLLACQYALRQLLMLTW